MRLFCRHRWQARATTVFPCDTEVLLVCSVCGKPKTKTLEGRWKLEDFLVFSEKDAERLLEKH